MKVYFVYKKVITGGCELLIERLGKELVHRSIKVCLVFQDIEPDMQLRYENDGIDLLQVKQWNRKSIIARMGSKEVSIITFLWSDFLLCNTKKKHVHTMFYAVHYQAFELGQNRTFIKKKILHRIARNGINVLSNNHQIICMDEETLSYTRKLYRDDSFNTEILRLAIDIVPVLNHIFDCSKIHILTIARAEFPFKGYILGLLDWFAATSCEDTLTIISYGPDEDRIITKIENYNKSVKSRIQFVGKTDYDQLEYYYQMADLYVGMGTTILDASLRGIVSIPVKPYTYDLITQDFFYKDYRKLGFVEGTKYKFNELCDQYKCLGVEDRSMLSKISREAVIENYSTAAIADRFIELLQLNRSNKTTAGLEFLRIYHEAQYALKGDIQNDNAK